MSAIASTSRTLFKSALCDCTSRVAQASAAPLQRSFSTSPSTSLTTSSTSFPGLSLTTAGFGSRTAATSQKFRNHQQQQQRGYTGYQKPKKSNISAVDKVEMPPSPLYDAIQEGSKSNATDELIRSGRAGEILAQQQRQASASAPPTVTPQEHRQDLKWLNGQFTSASYNVAKTGFLPCTPTSSRSIPFFNSKEFERSYRRLQSGVITANNIKAELKLLERYEKPHYKRQRLASARHRRRFAREVGLKVAAVMKAKSQGM